MKLAQPFKGPFICVKILHNNNVALSPLAGGKIIHTHLNNCKIVPLQPDHLVLNPLPSTLSPSQSHNSAKDFHYSRFLAESFECTEEDNAPAPPQPNAPSSRSPSPSPAASPLPPPPHDSAPSPPDPPDLHPPPPLTTSCDACSCCF